MFNMCGWSLMTMGGAARATTRRVRRDAAAVGVSLAGIRGEGGTEGGRDSLSVREGGRGGRACIMHRTCPRCHVHICRCMRSYERGPFPSLPAAKDFASSYFVFKGTGRSLAAALFLQLVAPFHHIRHTTTKTRRYIF